MKSNPIFILIFIALVSGCKKELGVYPLGTMKNQNPYAGNEVLKYLSNTGDTIIFIGQGRYSEEFQSPFDEGSSDKYYSNEIDRCSFTDQENQYEIYI